MAFEALLARRFSGQTLLDEAKAAKGAGAQEVASGGAASGGLSSDEASDAQLIEQVMTLQVIVILLICLHQLIN